MCRGLGTILNTNSCRKNNDTTNNNNNNGSKTSNNSMNKNKIVWGDKGEVVGICRIGYVLGSFRGDIGAMAKTTETTRGPWGSGI